MPHDNHHFLQENCDEKACQITAKVTTLSKNPQKGQNFAHASF